MLNPEGGSRSTKQVAWFPPLAVASRSPPRGPQEIFSSKKFLGVPLIFFAEIVGQVKLWTEPHLIMLENLQEGFISLNLSSVGQQVKDLQLEIN